MTLTRDPEKARLWRQRSKRIRRMSGRQQRWNAEFERAKVIVVRRSQGFCEMRTPVCRGFGEHVHHKAGRVGPGVNHPDLLAHTCEACHGYAHRHPAESYVAGWLVKRLGGMA